ncbi:MAG: methionyl-tRNA formyltransferase [Bradymonadia bacterium]
MKLNELRVLFMGTPGFAVPTLEALFAAGAQVVGVVSQPDRPKGRGMKLQRTPVAACADAHGAPVFQWPRLNNESFAALSALKPDLAVVVAYGKILPRRYLELPTHGCLNVHASILPKWRGAAPIQWSVMAGDAETGISVMQMDVGMDTGDVARIATTPIGPDETAGDVHDRLMVMGADLLVESVKALCEGTLTFTEQDHGQATMAPMLSKSDGRIDFNWPAQKVHDRIRGASPWPGAFIETKEGPLKLHASALAEGQAGAAPGTILAHDPEGPRVACGDGAITLLRLQRPGRKAVAGADFLRGRPLPVGVSL